MLNQYCTWAIRHFRIRLHNLEIYLEAPVSGRCDYARQQRLAGQINDELRGFLYDPVS